MKDKYRFDITPLVFQLNKGKLKLSSEVLLTLKRYVQYGSDDKEAGGVLLGRFLKGNNDVVIDAVTEPLPGDKQTRFSFYRAKKQHQKIIDSFWRESEGTITYLGEWHTHPEPVPTPSNVDTSDWFRRLKSDTFNNKLFFIIVGTKEIKCWYGEEAGTVLYSTNLI